MYVSLGVIGVTVSVWPPIGQALRWHPLAGRECVGKIGYAPCHSLFLLACVATNVCLLKSEAAGSQATNLAESPLFIKIK